MKLKKLLILLAALAVLAGLAVFKNLSSGKKQTGLETSAAAQVILDKEFTSAFIQKISVEKGDGHNEKFVFVKGTDGEWKLENFFGARVNRWNIDNLLKHLSRLKGEMRSEGSAVLGDYSLTDSQGIHIRLAGQGGKEVLHLVLSVLRPNRDQNFVRISDSPKVYASFTDLLSDLGLYSKDAKLDYKTFVDLRVFSFDTSQVSRFEIPDTGVILVKKENPQDKSAGWVFEKESAAASIDPSKVTQAIVNASNLYAKEVLDPKNASGYGINEKHVSLLLEHAKDKAVTRLELYLGQYNKDKKCYTVKAMPEGLFYEINDTAIEGLKKDRQFFIKSS